MASRFIHFPLIMTLLLSISTSTSLARELRPAEHGLIYEPDDSPQMSSFFGAGTDQTPTITNIPLPEARNVSDPSRGIGNGDRGGSRGGILRNNQAREVVFLASAVCGIAGIVLLLVAVFLFLFRRRFGSTSEKVLDLKSPTTPLSLPPPAAAATVPT